MKTTKLFETTIQMKWKDKFIKLNLNKKELEYVKNTCKNFIYKEFKGELTIEEEFAKLVLKFGSVINDFDTFKANRQYFKKFI